MGIGETFDITFLAFIPGTLKETAFKLKISNKIFRTKTYGLIFCNLGKTKHKRYETSRYRLCSRIEQKIASRQTERVGSSTWNGIEYIKNQNFLLIKFRTKDLRRKYFRTSIEY